MKTLLALLAFTLTANAQLIVSMVGGDELSLGPGTAGLEFTTAAPITLRSLGLYDSDPLTPGLYNAHTVGLWDATTHTLIASATVPAQGAVPIGDFWYVALAAPVTLLAGHSYVLGASFADSDFDMARGNVTSVVTDPRIKLGDALLSTGVGFEYPDLNVSGANAGFFGANGLEAAVPEPATIATVVAFGLVGFALMRKRYLFALSVAWMTLLTVTCAEPTIRSILDAKPAERQRLFTALAKKRPAVYGTLTPAVNRPPVTPGNDKGNRPVVPPGIVRNYGTP